MSERISWIEKKFSIAGMELKEGDFIEIGLGRNRIEGRIMGFDRVLFCIRIVTTNDEEMIIPYKHVKYIKKANKKTE